MGVMEKTMRKTFCICAALLTMVVALTFVACNDTEQEKPVAVSKYVEGMDDFAYYADDETVTLFWPKDKTIKSVTIPACVSEIDANAFDGCTSLEEVKFEEGSKLKRVNTFAFKDCTALKSISLPLSVELLGDRVFYGCTSLEEVDFSGDGIKSCGSLIFEKCTNLKRAVVPACMTSVSAKEFKDCALLENVSFGNGVTTIEDNAFCDKKLVGEMTFPSSLKKIGSRAFYGNALSAISFPENVESIGAYAFYDNELSGSLELPHAVTSIEEYAFYGNNFSDIRFPENVKTIGAYAFYDNELSGSLELPDTVVSVGDYAFYGHEFSALKFLSGSTSIGKGAFYSDKNSKLTSLSAPYAMRKDDGYAFEEFISKSALASVEMLDIESGNIEYGALLPFSSLTNLQLGMSVDVQFGGFYGLDKLQSVKMPQSNITVEEDGVVAMCGFAGFFGFYESENMMSVRQSYIIEGETIYSEDFTVPSSLTKVEITLPYIGSYAFENMTELTDIIVTDLSTIALNALDNTGWYNRQEDGVLCIAKTAYGYKGTNPRELTIPEGVQKIQPYAFALRPVQSVVLPSSLTEFDRTAFYVSYLKEISFSNDNSKFKAIDNCLIQGSKVIFGVGGNIPSNNGTIDVTEIGEEAFAHTSVVDVTIPDTITKIGKSAFEEASLASVTFGANSNLETIGERAFFGTKVAAVAIPDSVTSIGKSAFEDSNVAAVTFGADSKITSVGDKAFYNTRLESVNIPKKLSEIGVRAFASGKLNYVSVDTGNETFKVINNCLVKGQTVVLGTSGSTIPTTTQNVNDKDIYDVLSIGDYAFANVKITSISIPSHIVSIGAYAFDESSIVSITFETKTDEKEKSDGKKHTAQKLDLQTIGEGAFANCLNLESIIIPYSVKTVEKSLFAGSGLKEIVFAPYIEKVEWSETDETGQTVNKTETISAYYLETIKENAFVGTKLTGVTIPSSVVTIGEKAFFGVPLASVTFDDNSKLESIGNSAFENTLLESIVLPYSLKSIGEKAFFGVPLASVTFDDNSKLKSIGNSAFENTNIENITLPTSLTTIGTNAFVGTKLTSVTIPASVVAIGEKAFAGLNLEFIEFKVQADNGGYGLQSIAQNAFEGCPVPKSVTAPMGIISKIKDCFAFVETINVIGNDDIPAQAFSGWIPQKTKAINICEGVRKIGDMAFLDCEMTSFVLPASVTEIGNGILTYCPIESLSVASGNARYYVKNNYIIDSYSHSIVLACKNSGEIPTSFKWVTVDNKNVKEYDVTAIAKSAFKGVEIEKITIPSNVKSIDDYTFEQSPLKEVVISSGVESIGRGAFDGATNLSKVTVADSVKSIGYAAFRGTEFYAQKQATEKGISYIGKVAYAYHGDKTEVGELEVADGTVGIAEHAFERMSNLKKLILPSSLKNIDKEAFVGCKNLTNLYFNGTDEEWKAVTKVRNWDLNLPTHKTWTLCRCEEKSHDHDGDGVVKAPDETADICQNYKLLGADMCEECSNKEVDKAVGRNN